MFFFNINFLDMLIVGTCWVVFAGPIAKYAFKAKPDTLFEKPIVRKIFLIWPLRILGLALIAVFVYMGINNPYRGMMKKDENKLALLERGEIVEAILLEDGWYDEWAPTAWMILYSFEATNPSDGKTKTYYGSARGPKHYYSKFSKSDTVSIIYDPSRPKINCEMFYFMNNPHYRRAFRIAGKLETLLEYKDKYEFEDFSSMSWHYSSRQE